MLFFVIFRGVRILHCRSYVPAIMGLLVRTLTPTRLLFDMRGLFVDEYLLEGALREGSPKLALARWLERRLLFRSDAIVVVSERFRAHLLSRPDLRAKIRPERIHVIPNRVERTRFDSSQDQTVAAAREAGLAPVHHSWQGPCIPSPGTARVDAKRGGAAALPRRLHTRRHGRLRQPGFRLGGIPGRPLGDLGRPGDPGLAGAPSPAR